MRPSLFSPASQGPSRLAVSLLSAHPDRPSHACPSQWQSLTRPSKLSSARALASRDWHSGHPDACFPVLDAPGRLTAGEGRGALVAQCRPPAGGGKRRGAGWLRQGRGSCVEGTCPAGRLVLWSGRRVLAETRAGSTGDGGPGPACSGTCTDDFAAPRGLTHHAYSRHKSGLGDMEPP